MSKKQPIERVVWVDSCTPRGWTHRNDLKGYKATSCVSVGFVVSEDAKNLTLASHDNPSGGQVDGIMCIPKVSIKSRKVIA